MVDLLQLIQQFALLIWNHGTMEFTSKEHKLHSSRNYNIDRDGCSICQHLNQYEANQMNINEFSVFSRTELGIKNKT